MPSGRSAPLATLAHVQEAVGRIEALLLSNRRLLSGLADDLDQGAQVPLADSGLVKTLVMRQAVELVQEALALTSNHGLSRRNPLERHLRDVLRGRIHTPQEDSALVLAGRQALEQLPRAA